MATFVLLTWAVMLSVWSAVHGMALDSHAIGFHQGTKQTVACETGGTIRGLELTTEMQPTFSDPVVASLRVICSSSKITIDGKAAIADDHRFGPAQVSNKLEASCPSGSQLIGLKWRLAHQTTNCEKRAAGVTLICGSAKNTVVKELRVDTSAENPTTQHQFHVMCPQGAISSFFVWHNHWEFNGFEVADCTAATSTTAMLGGS